MLVPAELELLAQNPRMTNRRLLAEAPRGLVSLYSHLQRYRRRVLASIYYGGTFMRSAALTETPVEVTRVPVLFDPLLYKGIGALIVYEMTHGGMGSRVIDSRKVGFALTTKKLDDTGSTAGIAVNGVSFSPGGADGMGFDLPPYVRGRSWYNVQSVAPSVYPSQVAETELMVLVEVKIISGATTFRPRLLNLTLFEMPRF